MRRLANQLNNLIRSCNALLNDVIQNAADIATNLAAIEDNDADISTNASAISTLDGRLDTVEGWGDHGEAGYVTASALGVWAGSINITTLGTIASGTWQGTAVADSYVASAENWNTAYGWGDHSEAGYLTEETDPIVGAIDGIVKANGAGAVSAAVAETDYLSTAWTGSESVATVGTIATGVWQGTAIADDYIASAATWTENIATNASAISDCAGAIAGNTEDIGTNADAIAAIEGDYLTSAYAGSENIVTVGTIGSGTWQGTAIDHERGGLEADVSAYDGLVKISGGVTSAVTDNSGNWDTAYGWGNHADATYVTAATLAVWAGSANIATVGTIGTGVWQGTAIADDYIASAATWNAKEDTLTFSDSLNRTDDTINLDGDSASPGNSKLYGTNGSGTKGWYDQPSAIADGTANQVYGMNSGASAKEWKTISGTANQVTVTHAANSITLATPQSIATTSAPQFAGITAAYIKPSSNSTTAVQIRNASGTGLITIDTTNGRMGVNLSSAPTATLDVNGLLRFRI